MDAVDEYIANGYKISPAKPTQPAADLARVNPIGAKQLAEKEFVPLVEVVHGLILEGLTIFCGPSKSGKSWFILSACMSVASGKPFLGRQTAPGKVLYCAFEDGERRLQARLQKLGIPPDDNLSFETRVLRLDDGLLVALEAWIKDNPDAKLIVIDTLQKVRNRTTSRANAYAEDYDVMGKLKALADRYHIAVVVVHHTNKLRDAADPFDKISGSTGLMGAADTAILISRKRGEDDATITYTGRDVWGDDFKIRFQDCRWTLCDPAALAREKYENSPIVQAIRAFIAQPVLYDRHEISFRDFQDWSRDRGWFIGATSNETHKLLDSMAADLVRFDGIRFRMKQVGTCRGFEVIQK